MNGKYILMDDIDLSTVIWDTLYKYNGTNYSFRGVLDGNGYEIHVDFTTGKYDDFALVHTNEGEICNILVSGQVTAASENSINRPVAGIALYNKENGIVCNCTSALDIMVADSMPVYVGGIVYHNIGTIDYCRYTGNMKLTASSGDILAGGIVYKNENTGTVSFCETIGKIEGIVGNSMDVDDTVSSLAVDNTVTIGGIAAYTNAGEIKQCRMTGKILLTGNCYNGYWRVGGIIGSSLATHYWDCCFNGDIESNVTMVSPSSGYYYVAGLSGDNVSDTVERCYVSGTILDCGAKLFFTPRWLFGKNADNTIDCYYPSGSLEPSMDVPEGGCMAVSLASMAAKSTFSGFDFTNDWTMGDSYPIQIVFSHYYAGVTDDSSQQPDVDEDQINGITDEEYIQQHLAFALSSEYQLRMDSRFAKILDNALYSEGAQAAEIIYDILNTTDELLKFQSLSIFKNPYEAVLTELMFSASNESSYSLESQIDTQLWDMSVNLWNLLKTNWPDASVGDYQPAILAFLEEPQSLKASNPDMYEALATALENYYDEVGAYKALQTISKTTAVYGKINDFLEVLNAGTEIAEGISECVRFTGSVRAYKSLSQEYLDALDQVAAHMDEPGFDTVLDRYRSWLTEDEIAAQMYEKQVWETAEAISDSLAPMNQHFITAFLSEQCGLPAANIQAVLLAFNVGWSLSDTLTNNDKIIECRALLQANASMESGLYQVVCDAREKLISNPTMETAKCFDAAYMLLRNSEIYSLQIYKDYLEAQQESFTQGVLHYGSHNFNADEIMIANYEVVQWNANMCHGARVEKNIINQITINGAADIEVYDENKNLVLSIIDGKVTQSVSGISASDSNGIKVITFGNDQTYKVKIKGTETLDCVYAGILDGEVQQRVVYEDITSSSYTITITPSEEANSTCVMNGGYGNVIVNPSNTITGDIIPVTDIMVSGRPTMVVGDVFYPIQKMTVMPANATILSVSYISSNPEVASIDADGKVHALKYGITNIRVSAMDGSGVFADYKLYVGASLPFDDVKDTDWFYPSVSYVYKNGFMTGTSQRTFGSNETTTRAMLVTILYRQEGEPSIGTSNFKDVAANMYYSKAVAWAAKNGIVNGFSETRFGPDEVITREQLATILYRYAVYKGYDVSSGDYTSLKTFVDCKMVSSWANNGFQWAYGEGLINGIGNNVLNPGGNATRAQMATILMRFCENIVG